MATNGNANAVPFIRNSNLFRKRIMDSLVCWYDIGKQQCTNESMASNPTLRDLSGNGHDATCYNFAWSGMSGIGGYAVDFTDGTPTYVTIIEHTYKIIRCTTRGTNCWLWSYDSKIHSMAPFSVKISGLSGKNITYFYSDGTIRKNVKILSDGVYNLPGSILIKNEGFQCGFYMSTYEQSLNVTIEQLPKYPNALVADGVDDYAKVTGLPIFTKEKGYTVIAKRDYIDLGSAEHNGILLAKKNSFSIENYLFKEQRKYRTYSFGEPNILNEFAGGIMVQTSKKYAQKSINVGSSTDEDILYLFDSGNNWKSKCALYSFLLFDRDLTTAEIEWVKHNLIKGDNEL